MMIKANKNLQKSNKNQTKIFKNLAKMAVEWLIFEDF